MRWQWYCLSGDSEKIRIISNVSTLMLMVIIILMLNVNYFAISIEKNGGVMWIFT